MNAVSHNFADIRSQLMVTQDNTTKYLPFELMEKTLSQIICILKINCSTWSLKIEHKLLYLVLHNYIYIEV